MKRKVRILIVEDEFLATLLLQDDLSRSGYEVCEPVGRGEDAIASVERERPDIVLIDIGLTGKMDGIEAAREIFTRFQTPIIFMTGYSDTETVGRAEQLQPVACLTKPISLDELDAAIDLAVGDGADPSPKS